MIKMNANPCDGIYSHCLDVRFTWACDNDCSFCIEKQGIDSLGSTNAPRMIESTLKSGVSTVLILGGEPFLDPVMLLNYVLGIRKHIKKIYITTSMPATIDPTNPVVQKILNTVDGLNVSLHHYDYQINNHVLKATSKHDRVSQLAELLKNPIWQSKIRVSVNLTAGYIDNRHELLKFLGEMEQIGCQHVKVVELQSVSKETFVSFEEIFDAKLPSPYSTGCQRDMSAFFENLGFSIKVTLKRSCFMVKDPAIAKANLFDFIKCVRKNVTKQCSGIAVLYEDGSLQDGWLIKENILAESI